MKGLWIIARYLIAIAAIVALQIFPYTGVFLMMFVAALWAMILSNLMLLHVGYSAITRKIERAWLFLPVAVYIGWAAASGVGYVQALGVQRAENAITRKTPVLSNTDRTFIVNSKDTAAAFATIFKASKVYGSGRIFERRPCNFGVKSEWRNEGEISELCTPPENSSGRCLQSSGSCLFSKNETAASEGIVVNVYPMTVDLQFARVSSAKAMTFSRVRAGMTAEPIGEIRLATVGIVWPVPAFYAGCYLNSNTGWKCVWDFWRMSILVGRSDAFGRYLTDMDDAVFVAEHLGIPHFE